MVYQSIIPEKLTCKLESILKNKDSQARQNIDGLMLSG